MKKALLLLLAVSLNGVASEVGAPSPQLADTTTRLAVAIADTGTSTRWANQLDTKMASTRETNEFEMRAGRLGVRLHQELDAVIADKLDALIEWHYQ